MVEFPMRPTATAAIPPKTIPRARWLRIIPPTIIIYIIAYMDRVNISFAMAGGMNEALGMSLALSGLAAGIFFWGYMVLPVPGGHIAEHGSARNFILWTIIGWGGISFLSGFVHSGGQLLVMRFLLGVAEGGLYPAILVLLGNWFPQQELGRANALFLTSAPLSSVITNPISGWIVAHYSWRGLFFFEGIVSLALVFVWLPLITDRPEEAKWISEEERDYLVTTLAAEKAESRAAFKTSRHGKSSYVQLFKNQSLWLMVGIYFCYTTGLYGYLIWLPTLLKNLTHASLTNVGWLSAPPLAVAVAGVYLFGALSDRKGNRRLHCAVALFGFAIAYSLSTLVPHRIWLAYTFLVIAGLFFKAMQGPFWSMPSLVFPPGTAGGARGIINGVGNLGGFAGSWLVGWLTSRTGNMNYGIYGLTIVLLLGGILTMLMPGVTAGFKPEALAEPAGSSK
jgi:sugar phosphate permease